MIRNLGPHDLNENAVERYCMALPADKELLDKFDDMSNIITRACIYVTRSRTDKFGRVVEEFIKEKC